MSGQRIPPAWSERGYVPPEQLNLKDHEDEKGEAAYMRCFHESSKIGRVPNASFFVNSPTARAYVQKRDKELFPVKEVSGKLIPNPDMPSWLSSKDVPKVDPQPMSEIAASVQALPPSQTTNGPPFNETLQLPLQAQSSTLIPSNQPSIPWSIEPQTGARGPPRMIR
jgi:hypothetical protein